MKLKLHINNTDVIRTSLSIISNVRKFVVLKFTPELLVMISSNSSMVSHEPQIWCKMPITSAFDYADIQSIRENTILLEVNLELFLQTLRNYEKANNANGLNIRLQRKDTTGAQGVSTSNSRTATLAFFYSDTTLNGKSIDHTFRVPVKILKEGHDAVFMKEPELDNVDIMTQLPNQFVALYRRLDKFKKLSNNEDMIVNYNHLNEGTLEFILEEKDKFRVTISWNKKLEIQRPSSANSDLSAQNSDSIRHAVRELGNKTAESGSPNAPVGDQDKQVKIKIRDWCLSSKIVSTCKTVVFLMTHQQACVFHCILDDTNDVEIIYHLKSSIMHDPDLD